MISFELIYYQDSVLCDVDELYGFICALKASGPDGISGTMLKGVAHSIAPVLVRLFNRSIRTGRVPDMWKVASVVPIPATETTLLIIDQSHSSQL